jgi:hypothetical protein
MQEVRTTDESLRERDGQRQPFWHRHDHDRHGDGEEVDQGTDVVRREMVEVDRGEESGRPGRKCLKLKSMMQADLLHSGTSAGSKGTERKSFQTGEQRRGAMVVTKGFNDCANR